MEPSWHDGALVEIDGVSLTGGRTGTRGPITGSNDGRGGGIHNN